MAFSFSNRGRARFGARLAEASGEVVAAPAATACRALGPAADVADSEATTVAALRSDFNTLLGSLRDAGLLGTADSEIEESDESDEDDEDELDDEEFDDDDEEG